MIRAGDWFYHVGEGDGYDHFIHSIECIEEGWTLNLYSDDAQKALSTQPRSLSGSMTAQWPAVPRSSQDSGSHSTQEKS